jgi:hypothetical protein
MAHLNVRVSDGAISSRAARIRRRVGATRRIYTDNLFRDVPPVKPIDDPDAAGVFEVDEELDEFPAIVRAGRVAKLA